MVRTLVGYTGGTKEGPTYRDLGDHTEAIQIDYDPVRISYPELLDVFWAGHNPTYRSSSRQYQAFVFFHDEEQKRQALASREREAASRGREIHTRIRPATTFYSAEDYHQKFRLRQNDELARELLAIYPDPVAFTASTAAARMNGYVAGEGMPAAFEADLPRLGLSVGGRARLARTYTAAR